MKNIILLFLCVCVVFPWQLMAQKNKKSEDKYEFAKKSYQNGDAKQSITILKQLMVEDSTYSDPYLYLSEIYFNNDKYKEMIVVYEKLAKNCGKNYPNAYMLLANSQMYILGDIQKARANYQTFLQQKNLKLGIKQNAEQMVKRCDYALDLMTRPVPFNPQNMGDSVNSICSEYFPYLSPDEKTLVITRKVPKYMGADPASDDTQEDFYICEWKDRAWSKARSLPGNVNTKNNEGAQTISGDGQYMVLAACNRSDGMGECDLYFSKKIDGKWTSPTNMGYIVNSAFYESQPSLSADGQTLYFVGYRPGGIGNHDIWVTIRNEYGKWTKPIPLDTTINTLDEEQSPFIHPDGRTLYFCSNGHMGVGGFDIFFSKKDEDGKWSKPKNLGYPINTSKDEIGMMVNTKGDKAYITSSRDGGVGLQDIYMFDLYKEARPELVTYFKGNVTDADGKPIKADFELKEVETGKTVMKSTTDENDGSFLVCLVPGKDYALFVTSEGKMFYSENINLTKPSTSLEPVIKNIPLAKVTKGQKIILKNIFFDTDSFNLKPTSVSELNKLIAFLNTNPKIKIEIGGHTDNVGKPVYNLDLSMKRAKSVYSFLTAHGIVALRLTYKGFGDTVPIATNDNEEGRAQNRRTEMKILE